MDSVVRCSRRVFVLGLPLALAGCVNTQVGRPASPPWHKIVFGMTRAQVHKLIGKSSEPTADPNREIWRQSPGQSWFFVVRYDAKDRVSDYRSVFYENQ